jgi:O-antigen ligase
LKFYFHLSLPGSTAILMKKRDSLLLIFFLLFFISLFISRLAAASVTGMALLVAFSFTYGPFRQKVFLFKQRKHLWFMLGFALMLLISFFVSEDQRAGGQYLARRVPLFMFPVSVGLLQISKELRNKILLGLAIIVSAACLLSLGWAIYRFTQTKDSAWLYNDSLSYFIGQQSIYTSVFVNISIYVFVWHLLYSSLSDYIKLWLGLGIAFLFIISYMLASRNMMLILYSTIILFVFYGIIKKKKYLEGIVLLVGIVLAGALVNKFFPKTVNRFKELTFTQFNYQSKGKESHYNMELTADQWNGANFRLAAWPCGWQLFKEHPITGVGLGDKRDELFRVYEQRKFHFALATRKNVHNNYLDVLYSMGIIGFILFFTGWIALPLIRTVKKRDGLAFLIILTITLAMITEIYFDRSLGAMLSGLLIPFVLTANGSELEMQNECG